MQRQALGLTQRDAADAIPCSVSFYNDVENGRKYPATERLPDWSRALKITVGAMFGESPPRREVHAVDIRGSIDGSRIVPRRRREASQIQVPAAWLQAAREYWALEVSGAGYRDLALADGDVLIIDKGVTPRSGDLVLCGSPAGSTWLATCAQLHEQIVVPNRGANGMIQGLVSIADVDVLGVVRHVARLGHTE